MATTNPTNTLKPEESQKTRFHETAGTFGEKAKETTQSMADRAKDAAKDAASNIGQKAENATSSVASGMESLAGTIRGNMPHKGMLGTASSSVADSLESGGRYLREEGLSGMAEDLTDLVRRNPIPALLCGVALGFMVARLTSRS